MNKPTENRGRQSRATAADRGLIDLVRAIASNDAKAALRLLASSPGLATAQADIGASREAAEDFFFEEIKHYLYAGDTALHMAAAGFRRDIAQALIDRGADCAARNRRGAQPLHYASDANTWDPDAQAATITCLLRAGADPNATDKSGVGPLHRAVRTRCAAAVDALLAGGADPRRKNKSGSTPLHLAAQTTGRGGSGEPRAIEEQRQIIRLLLRHGANPKDRNGQGKTVEEVVTTEWIRHALEERE